MTFLKKLGQVIANIAGIASGIGPIFAAAIPKAAGAIATGISDLQAIASEIATVETIGNTVTNPAITGPTKLQMATPLVAQVIMQSALLAGKKIANPALYQVGSQKVADGMADILNSLHESGVTVTQP